MTATTFTSSLPAMIRPLVGQRLSADVWRIGESDPKLPDRFLIRSGETFTFRWTRPEDDRTATRFEYMYRRWAWEAFLAWFDDQLDIDAKSIPLGDHEASVADDVCLIDRLLLKAVGILEHDTMDAWIHCVQTSHESAAKVIEMIERQYERETSLPRAMMTDENRLGEFARMQRRWHTARREWPRADWQSIGNRYLKRFAGQNRGLDVPLETL